MLGIWPRVLCTVLPGRIGRVMWVPRARMFLRLHTAPPILICPVLTDDRAFPCPCLSETIMSRPARRLGARRRKGSAPVAPAARRLDPSRKL